MEFENTFQVQAPADDVWALLLDVERVAPCMPGAQVLERTGENAYKVAVKVKLGPMTMNYKGDVEIVEQDAAARRATLRAKAREARGQGTVQASITMSLAEDGGATTATLHTELQLSGKAASMGRGVIRDVAGSLTDTFARNLAGMVSGNGRAASAAAGEPPPAAAPEEPRAAASPPAGAAEAPPAAAPPPRPDAEPEGLDAGALAASIAAQRLRDPRTVGALLALAALLGFLLGRRSGR
jgi:carbon monoxide dehydrogenase subunit G